tara:strand:+ start:1289 stop:1546 length:258 start_codon:yes stop_codon:yes gene_type:complete
LPKKDIADAIVNNRERARQIVQEILNFGVNEQQKLHVMFLLALNLEDNKRMKEISNFLKKYEQNINTEKDSDTIIASQHKKTILT